MKKANSEWRVANGDVGGRAKPFAIRYSPFAPYLTKKERRVRILITNDDGIHAPGLEVCEQIARTLEIPVGTVYSRLRVAREEFAAKVKRLQASRRAS